MNFHAQTNRNECSNWHWESKNFNKIAEDSGASPPSWFERVGIVLSSRYRLLDAECLGLRHLQFARDY